jgi:ribonuclease D
MASVERMAKEQPYYTLIKDKEHLSRIAIELKKETEIAVDLESDSMFHYAERVCLLQISTQSKNILVDPFSLDDLSALSPVFSDTDIRKVFHGADYDIRSLYRDFGIEVNNLLDTQIAARFLGILETGLASLLKNRLGIVVEKKYQKKDWSRRPLPAAMLTYAVHDTCHLLTLFSTLETELRAKDRFSWAEEESRRLSLVRPAPPNDNPLFLKFKDAKKLDPRTLALLESILQLRQQTARRRDRPPFKIIGNEQIMEIALRKPRVKKDLLQMKGLSSRQVEILGASILKTTQECLSLPENKLPAFPRRAGPRFSAKASKKMKALKSWRNQRAEEMGIDPALVCSQTQIESLALSSPKSLNDLDSIDTLRTWQKKQFGREICSLLK